MENGDLVRLINESVKTHFWKMARVIEVYPGGDGVVQSTYIKTADRRLRRRAVKSAPLFYECSREGKRATDLTASDPK